MRSIPRRAKSRWLAGSQLALLCTLLVACGDSYDGPRLTKLQSEDVILAFGDSLTFGTGASAKSKSYPNQLAEITQLTVINAGIPGEKTAEGLLRLPAVLEKSQPQLVILCLGGNDMLRKKPRDSMLSNLDDMVELIEEAGADVVLLGVPEPALFSLSADPRYTQLAQQFALPIENEIISSVLGDSSLKSDPIHPNDAGYRKMAEAIAELLKQAGAI